MQKTFHDFGLSDELLRAVDALGYSVPTPIQKQALPILLGEGTDFIGLAATGTGKTAAFGLPLLERIQASKKVVQGLVLCPTRELAMQVAGQIDLLGKHKNIRALPVYGGASYIPQIHGLSAGVTIVVGTPGRVVDHLKRGTLKLKDVNTLILDEADEMFSMGFKEEIDTILSSVPREHSRIWLFSATMSKEVRRVVDTHLRDPQQVQVNRSEMLSTTVEQVFYGARESDKPEILCKLIEAADDFYGLVFCQTKSLVAQLSQYLIERGYRVDSLHGDKDQKGRERTMQAFRDKKATILICTDVASRGLDVKDVTHVINYSIPRELDSYVHRIGRTARSGKTGIAMSLVTPRERHILGRIEKMTKSKIAEGRIPTRREIGIKRIAKILPSFQDEKNYKRVLELIGNDWLAAVNEMDKAEIASRFIALLASDIFQERAEKSSSAFEGGNEEREERGVAHHGRRRDQENRSQSHSNEASGGGRRKFNRRFKKGAKPSHSQR